MTNVVIRTADNPEATVKLMVKTLLPAWKAQGAKFVVKTKAKKAGSDPRKLAKLLYDFCRANIKYRLDPANQEYIRSPDKTWSDRAKGVDCEDYVIFVGAVLLNLNVPFWVRTTDYGDGEGYSHIYIVLNDGTAIDPVMDVFGYEHLFVKKFDLPVSAGNGLSGVPKFTSDDISRKPDTSGGVELVRYNPDLKFNIKKGNMKASWETILTKEVMGFDFAKRGTACIVGEVMQPGEQNYKVNTLYYHEHTFYRPKTKQLYTLFWLTSGGKVIIERQFSESDISGNEFGIDKVVLAAKYYFNRANGIDINKTEPKFSINEIVLVEGREYRIVMIKPVEGYRSIFAYEVLHLGLPAAQYFIILTEQMTRMGRFYEEKPSPAYAVGDRVVLRSDTRIIGVVYSVNENADPIKYSVRWDGSRIGQAGLPESMLAMARKETPTPLFKLFDQVRLIDNTYGEDAGTYSITSVRYGSDLIHLYKIQRNSGIREIEVKENKIALVKVNPTPEAVKPKAKATSNKKSDVATKQAIEKFLNSTALGHRYTAEELEFLNQYEGAGGMKDDSVSGQGLLYEFYTPEWLADKMYELAKHYGYKSGMKVLEPSCGTGRLVKPFVGDYQNITAFEINNFSARIAQANCPGMTIYNDFFETAFLQSPRFTKRVEKTWLPDAPFDLVIGNPPYGIYKNQYSSYFTAEKKNYKVLEMLFFHFAFKLLKPGGLVVYLVPQNIMRTGNNYQMGKAMLEKQGAELLDAYRLPTVFANSAVPTDLIILRKN